MWASLEDDESLLNNLGRGFFVFFLVTSCRLLLGTVLCVQPDDDDELLYSTLLLFEELLRDFLLGDALSELYPRADETLRSSDGFVLLFVLLFFCLPIVPFENSVSSS